MTHAEEHAATCGKALAWHSEPGAALYLGDCRTVMAQMPAESVDCVCFSPPFFGLRRYDGMQSVPWADGQSCAWGLEPSVELWVAHTLEVMQAVKRVLKPSGVAWLEVGDSYASGKGSAFNPGGRVGANKSLESHRRDIGIYPLDRGNKSALDAQGLKPKDLCLVPERLALALQATGWWVRSRIVWAKPNPMPESTTDRPTKSHSTIWMLTKAESYYFDQEAVREGNTAGTLLRWSKNPKRALHSPKAHRDSYDMTDFSDEVILSGRNLRDVWTLNTQPFGYELCQSCGQIYTAAQFGRLPTSSEKRETGRMKASGVEATDDERMFSTEQKLCRCGSSDFLSHFATFPEALPTRCILASTSEAGCCPKCGKPWERKIEKAKPPSAVFTNRNAPTDGLVYSGSSVGGMMKGHGQKLQNWRDEHPAQTLGWAATCECGLPQAENVPCTILDPCCGSGTTLVAAKKLGRRAVGIDLSEKYLALSRRRLEEVSLPLGKGGEVS